MLIAAVLLLSSLCQSVAQERPPLAEVWDNYTTGPLFHRWWEYAPVYQKFLGKFKYGEKIKMLEIGVQSGGSVVTWNQWFTDCDYTYVGIDINPLCKQLDTSEDDKIFIEIGSQTNATFLNEVCAKHGPFDIIIDDGGHTTEMVMISLRTLFPCMTNHAYYVIEDIMTITFGEHMAIYEGKTTAEHLGDVFSSMHANWIDQYSKDKGIVNQLYSPIFSDWVRRMYWADSIAVLERKPRRPLTDLNTGTERIPDSPVGRVELILPDKSELVVELNVGAHSSEIPHDELDRQCREICSANPGLIEQTGSLEQCGESLKRVVIRSAYNSDDDYLYSKRS